MLVGKKKKNELTNVFPNTTEPNKDLYSLS